MGCRVGQKDTRGPIHGPEPGTGQALEAGLGRVSLEVMLKVWEWTKLPREWTWRTDGRA